MILSNDLATFIFA